MAGAILGSSPFRSIPGRRVSTPIEIAKMYSASVRVPIPSTAAPRIAVRRTRSNAISASASSTKAKAAVGFTDNRSVTMPDGTAPFVYHAYSTISPHAPTMAAPIRPPSRMFSSSCQRTQRHLPAGPANNNFTRQLVLASTPGTHSVYAHCRVGLCGKSLSAPGSAIGHRFPHTDNQNHDVDRVGARFRRLRVRRF